MMRGDFAIQVGGQMAILREDKNMKPGVYLSIQEESDKLVLGYTTLSTQIDTQTGERRHKILDFTPINNLSDLEKMSQDHEVLMNTHLFYISQNRQKERDHLVQTRIPEATKNVPEFYKMLRQKEVELTHAIEAMYKNTQLWTEEEK